MLSQAKKKFDAVSKNEIGHLILGSNCHWELLLAWLLQWKETKKITQFQKPVKQFNVKDSKWKQIQPIKVRNILHYAVII